MANLRISELIQRTPNGEEYFEVIIPPFTPGTNRKVLLSDIFAQLNPDRGDYAGTTQFPTSGGTFTGGAPARGNHWTLTDVLVVGGNVYDVGTVIEARVDNPGATTLADWKKYSMQA